MSGGGIPGGIGGAARSSGSFGGGSPIGAGAATGAGGLLNNKWLYERGRDRGSPGTPGSRGY